MESTKTLKLRIKDKHAKVLAAMAREVKFCKKCNTEKSLEAFSNNRSKPDGRASTCKVCQKTITAVWRENNPAASKAATSNWVKQNSDRYAEYTKEWRDANRAARSQYSVDWAKTNPARKNATTAKRRAAEAGATFGDAGEIRMWYEVAEVLSRGGVKFQVDHIVPLISKDVCGLHAPWHMTVLSQRQNASKGNRWWPEHQAGIVFEVVNESYTTQTCSCCGIIPASSPKGRAGLRIREWVCSGCGAVHDRDINAARNILAAGHRRLAEGITVSSGR